MAGFMDKMKQAAGGVADVTKKGAAAAQTKAKVHGLRGKADEAAKQLGYLVFRERTSGEAAAAEADELVKQIADLEQQIAEAQVESDTPEGEAADPADPAEGDEGSSTE